VGDLDRQFDRISCARGPYFFPELFQTGELDELDAINQGLIRAVRIDYVGRAIDHGENPRPRPPL
jgi:hypothetical protein